MADRIGQQFGNYRLVRLIGSGGFADVYLGEHIYLNTLAAIKMLHLRLARADQEIFLQEARIVASLSHPHIVRVLDYGLEDKTPYLLMDYAPNGTLRQRYPKGVIVPLSLVVSHVRQAASALQYAHDKKLIHRDVKPENMLLGANNEVLLADFGTASFAQTTQLQNPGKVIGTVAYMAPEQFKASAHFASDQYALGIIVYEWLCGERPFEGSFIEVATKHLITPPEPLRRKNSHIPPAVEEVVMAALAKDPYSRFRSVKVFATALEQASRLDIPLLPNSNALSSSGGPPLPPVSSASETMGAVAFTRAASQPMTPLPALAAPAAEAVNTVESGFPQQQVSKRHLSRRAVVGGLVGVAVVVAGGVIVWERTQMPALTYRGHSSRVFAVAWAPDGAYLVSGGFDNTAQIWDAFTGKTLLIYRGHRFSVNGLAWSPNGTQVASASGDTTVQVWEHTTGHLHLIYRNHTAIMRTVAWSPDEQRIASGGDDMTVQVWEAAIGKPLVTYKGHSRRVWAVAWSPDPNGRFLASASADTTVQVWEASTGNKLITYPGHSMPVKAAAWSRDGTRIASGGDDTTVQVWNALSGQRTYTYWGHTGHVNGISWSPDGTHIASGGDDATIQVWEAATGRLIHTYDDLSGSVVHAVSWSPGAYIAAALTNGTVQVWNAP